MPKAAVNEDHLFSPWKNQVGSARKFSTVESEAKTQSMGHAPDHHFRFCVLATNARHQPGAAFGCNVVDQGSLSRLVNRSTCKRPCNLSKDSFGKDGGDAVADHSMAVPFRRMELEPIRKPLKARCLPYRYDARLIWMDGACCLIRPPIIASPGTKHLRRAVPSQTRKFAHPISLARCQPGEAVDDRPGMSGSLAPTYLACGKNR